MNRARRRAVALLGLASLAAAVAAACAHRSAADRGPVLDAVSGPGSDFKHGPHLLAIAATGGSGEVHPCAVCHNPDPNRGFAAQRPGNLQHWPCDNCHAKKYFEKPGTFCGTCHESVDPLRPNNSPLFPYPRRRGRTELVSAFSHKIHLESSRVRSQAGKDIGCTDCHALEGKDSAYISFPRHSECVGCHAPGPRAPSPVMNACAECHDHPEGPGRLRQFLKNDVRFTHARHGMDASGNVIPCETCHVGMERSRSSQDLVLPEMRACTVCHSDRSRTPERVGMKECGVCHASGKDATALPGDHTASVEGAREHLAADQRSW